MKNVGTGLNFDTKEYEKRFKIVLPEEIEEKEKKEKKEEKDKTKEQVKQKKHSETMSRIFAQIIGSLCVSLVGLVLFIALGGTHIFNTGFEARKEAQEKYEEMETGDKTVEVTMADGSQVTMTWNEYVNYLNSR